MKKKNYRQENEKEEESICKFDGGISSGDHPYSRQSTTWIDQRMCLSVLYLKDISM